MNFISHKSKILLFLPILICLFVPTLVSVQAEVNPPATPTAAPNVDSNKPPATPTSSANDPKEIITLKNPLKVNSIGELVQNFVEIFSYVVILGAVLALIWVGLQFILARGNPAKMVVLKEWLLWIIVGVAIVIGARLIIQVVINTLSASGTVDQRTIQSVQKAVNGQ